MQSISAFVTPISLLMGVCFVMNGRHAPYYCWLGGLIVVLTSGEGLPMMSASSRALYTRTTTISPDLSLRRLCIPA